MEKELIPQFIHTSDIIQGEVIVYLDGSSTKHLTFLIIPKSHILLV
jgi:hypothetical protein